MARIRTVKPGFYTNEELSQLHPECHLFAGGLLNQADDEGYFKANPGILKGAIFPLRECSVSAQTYLNELAQVGWIELGTGPDHKRYGHIVNFREHQVINRATPSKIKQMGVEWEKVPEVSGNTHGAACERSMPEGNGREEEKDITPPTPSRRKRRTRDDVISGYSEEVRAVVNTLIEIWPTKQPKDGKPIHVDVAQFSSRVKHIIQHGKSAPQRMAEILIECGRYYVAQPKQCYHAPQYFFGPGNGMEPPWYECAEYVTHRQQQATVGANA